MIYGKNEDMCNYFKGTRMKELHLINPAALAALCATGVQAQSHMADNGSYGEIGYTAVNVTGARGDAMCAEISGGTGF